MERLTVVEEVGSANALGCGFPGSGILESQSKKKDNKKKQIDIHRQAIWRITQ